MRVWRMNCCPMCRGELVEEILNKSIKQGVYCLVEKVAYTCPKCNVTWGKN